MQKDYTAVGHSVNQNKLQENYFRITTSFSFVYPPRTVASTMYGNNIDSTYKTTKYDFFVPVKTTVGYSVVAEFIIQSETAPHISEALRVFSQWNPTWKPNMTDYSDAEVSAIEAV